MLGCTGWGTGCRRSPPRPARSSPWRRQWPKWRGSGGTSGRSMHYRRRIYTEEKAKVVAASWGTEFIQILAAVAILHQDELNNRLICTLFFNSPWRRPWQRWRGSGGTSGEFIYLSSTFRETVHEIFDNEFFCSNGTPLGPWPTVYKKFWLKKYVKILLPGGFRPGE